MIVWNLVIWIMVIWTVGNHILDSSYISFRVLFLLHLIFPIRLIPRIRLGSRPVSPFSDLFQGSMDRDFHVRPPAIDPSNPWPILDWSCVHAPNFIVQFCASNGKYVTSMLHELFSMAGGIHVTSPSYETTAFVFCLTWKSPIAVLYLRSLWFQM